ncbi:MAG TPA: endonuclease VII domain-containing protein [Blastocatellia bacterium]|nr:endonuclease VII domain-containing protein [Blastocatellia bacterium]
MSGWQRDLRRAYGITPEEYAEMYVAQKGCCKLCGDRIWFKHKTTHIDHCHNIGKIRGVLCIHCNRGLGGVRDSPQALYRALHYVLTGGEVPGDEQVERIVEGLETYFQKNPLDE